MKRAQYQTHN